MTRRRPWRAAHPGAVVVARPTKCGNPFRVGTMAGVRLWTGGPHEGRWGGVVAADRPDQPVEAALASFPAGGLVVFAPVADAAAAAALFWEMLTGDPDLAGQARVELAGKDLACWCPLDQPCHADTLLEIANLEATR
jgi:hypothetical protein